MLARYMHLSETRRSYCIQWVQSPVPVDGLHLMPPDWHGTHSEDSAEGGLRRTSLYVEPALASAHGATSWADWIEPNRVESLQSSCRYITRRVNHSYSFGWNRGQGRAISALVLRPAYRLWIRSAPRGLTFADYALREWIVS
jgi:hypothetical protein